MAITKEQIWDSAEELQADGERVTLAAVRKKLGDKGSYTTISDALKEWRARNTAKAAPKSDPRPAAVTAALDQFGDMVWSCANELGHANFNAEREALAAKHRELEDEKLEAAQLADSLTDEVETLRAGVAEVTGKLQAAAAERDKLSEQLIATTMRATTSEARSKEIEARANEHAEELRRVHAERKAESEQSRQQIEQLQSEIREARTDLNVRANEHAEELRRMHAERKAESEQSRRQVEQLQSEIREVRTDRERTRAELATLTTTAELARVRLEDSQKRTADDAATLKQIQAALDAARAEAAKATAAATAAETIASDYKQQLAHENARFNTLATAIAAGTKPPKAGGK